MHTPDGDRADFQRGELPLLFEGPCDLSNIHPHYDVAPDGRFLARKVDEERSTLDVILNWSEEPNRLTAMR